MWSSKNLRKQRVKESNVIKCVQATSLPQKRPIQPPAGSPTRVCSRCAYRRLNLFMNLRRTAVDIIRWLTAQGQCDHCVRRQQQP